MQKLNSAQTSIATLIRNSLSNKSEVMYFPNFVQIVYIFPAIPSVILFFVSIVSSSIYITKKSEYLVCSALNSSETILKTYLFWSIIVSYIFIGFYANMLLEFIPKLNGLVWNFIYLILYLIGGFIVHIIGISAVSSTKCVSVSYLFSEIYFVLHNEYLEYYRVFHNGRQLGYLLPLYLDKEMDSESKVNFK